MTETTIRRLVGVYHADGGVRGEVSYAIGKLRGTTHCALCDITHRGVRRRPEWAEVVGTLGVPFELVHLNERSDAVVAASHEGTPCVLAEIERGPDRDLVVLLGPAELDAVGGNISRFTQALYEAVRSNGLRLPAADGGG